MRNSKKDKSTSNGHNSTQDAGLVESEVVEPEVVEPEVVEPVHVIADDNMITLVEKVSEYKPNVLNVYKTVVTHLISFEILIIRVIPYKIASIDIEILTNNGHIYRTVNLAGPDYTKWSISDGYLFDFVRENIDTIY